MIVPPPIASEKHPTEVCQGFYLREVNGVDITDRYHVQVDGKQGFYGVANHRSYVERELRGTFKSVFCLITGECIIDSHINILLVTTHLHMFAFLHV